ncbi:TetR/AcrR family transcriptional regulator [Sphingobium algorifonticola]|uniref:TetR/AcrR family transcriptional regulator n=1 Tax=Sphingobium algorifonticola TaxID=2008318 RepID=A0A437J713_9SPHN|nr:TetR/AcrR family transcriptional regulator [Sphingobium algorifonticola]RVT40951.1 TetR/AcrR family transcriptional regulator [Sphingobium algorifonticola]
MLHGIASSAAIWAPTPSPVHGDADGAARVMQDDFLRAATCLINERSYRGASVERIAAHLNVTKGSFYHHIDSKDDLVEACFRRSFEIMTQSQFAVSGTADTAWASISGSVTDLLYRQFDDEAALLRSSALQALPPAVRAKVVAWSNRVARRYAGLLADGMADGSVRPVDPLIAAQTIMALVNSAYDLRWWAQRLTIDAAVASYGSNLAFGLVGKTS